MKRLELEAQGIYSGGMEWKVVIDGKEEYRYGNKELKKLIDGAIKNGAEIVLRECKGTKDYAEIQNQLKKYWRKIKNDKQKNNKEK